VPDISRVLSCHLHLIRPNENFRAAVWHRDIFQTSQSQQKQVTRRLGTPCKTNLAYALNLPLYDRYVASLSFPGSHSYPARAESKLTRGRPTSEERLSGTIVKLKAGAMLSSSQQQHSPSGVHTTHKRREWHFMNLRPAK